MADWDVVYRALADFSDLNREAAKAEATLKELQDAAKAEGQAEADAAMKAAAAHDADTLAIKRQQKAMEQATIAAAAYNKEVSHGGSSSMDGHLSQLAKERDLQTQLNRAKDRGFFSPQQAYSFRQQEMQQQLLYNRAIQQGFATPDQYLAYLQRQRTAMQGENTEWSRRAVLLDNATAAAATHADALQQTHASAQDLGRTGVDGVSAFSQAVGDLSGSKLAIDAKPAIVSVADLRAQIKGLSTDIASGKSSASDFLSRAVSIQQQMNAINKQNKGLSVRSSDVVEAGQDFTRLQQQADRAFKGIESSSEHSHQTLKSHFSDVKSFGAQTWESIASGAKSAASDTEGAFSSALAGIKGGFQGLQSAGSGMDLISSIGQTGSSLGAATGGFTLIAGAIAGLVSLLPALVAGLDAVASILFTLPALLTAAAGAFLVYANAIQPVIQAFGDFMKLLDAQQAAQANSIQTTMMVAQQQHALADAYFAVQQAAYQAAQSQLTDAHNVADAQFSLSQAIFNAGITQMQSAMQVAAAMHNLQQANFSVTQAQYQLTLAWQQAQQELASLELQVQYASTNLRGAQLGLAEAQQNYAMVMANSNSTALDRAQAAYQIQAAEEALQQVEQQNTANETKLNDVRQYGMQQVFGVTQAQNALVNAQFAQVQAQKQLIITQKEAANAQIQAAHAISDAVFALQQAQRQQSNDALVNAHNQMDAQFQLQQAMLQQKLGIGGVASAQEALNTAMSQLGPLATQALNYLKPLGVWWNNVWTIQNAFWKQVLPALANIKGIIAPVNSFLVATAGALGKVAGNFLTWFEGLAKSPLWKVLTSSTVTTILQLGGAFLKVVDGVVKLLAAAAPFTGWFLKGVVTLADKFDKWATNADKPGSTFKKWLQEIEPILHDVSGLFSSILDFFTDFATAQNLATFGNFVNALSNVVIPDLTTLLSALGNPTVANAVIALMNSVANLITIIVSSPGFTTALGFMLTVFSGLASLAAEIMEWKPAADVIGGLAGVLAAIAVLKFTGIFALMGSIGKIAGYIKDIKDAPGILGKIGAVFGRSPSTDTTGLVAGAEKAAPILSEAIVAGAKEAAPLLTGAEAEGGSVAATDIAGASAAGAGEAGAAGAAGGRLAGLAAVVAEVLPIALTAVLAAAVVQNILQHVIGTKNTKNFVDTPINIARGGTGPGGASTSDVAQLSLALEQDAPKIEHFFTSDLPKWAKEGWSAANNWFATYFYNPINNFINKYIIGFFTNDLPSWGKQGWAAVSSWFTQDIIDPIGSFFTQTIPRWFTQDIPNFAQQMWTDVENFFQQHIFQPLETFWTKTLPGWLLGLPDWFNTHVIIPIEGFFTHSLPNIIEQAFKDAVNWVITNVVNKAIGFINDVLGVIPGVSKIKPVQTLAVGGSVWGAGDQDSTPIMATPGEFMIRKGARNYLDQTYGPGFLMAMNNADILGFAAGGPIPAAAYTPGTIGYAKGGGIGGNSGSTSGSGGTPAGGGGGSILNSILGLFNPANWLKDLASLFGHIPGLGNLAGMTMEAAFNDVWTKVITPLLTSVTGTNGIPGHLAEAGLSLAKTGVDSMINSFMTAQATAASGGGGGPGVPGPGGGAPAANAALARRMMPAWGSGAEWAAWNAVAMAESGWNQYARNPSSGAYGIPQALPPSKMGAAANPPQSNPAAQISWMIGYIRGRYGDPIHAWAHEQAYHWYAKGGPIGYDDGGVIAGAVKGSVSDPHLQEAMMLGSLVATKWKANYLSGQNAGAWGINFKKYGLTSAQATNITTMAKALAPYYTKALGKYGWLDAHAMHRSLEIINYADQSKFKYDSNTPAEWAQVLAALGSSGGGGGGIGIGAPEAYTGTIPFTGPGSVAPAMALLPAGPTPSFGAYTPRFAFGGPIGFRVGGGWRPPPQPSWGGNWGRNFGPPDRLVNSAASATGVSGLSIGDVHIHNPVPEQAGDSLTRSVQRLAFMAGRGVA